jgi:hypothetical protein
MLSLSKIRRGGSEEMGVTGSKELRQKRLGRNDQWAMRSGEAVGIHVLGVQDDMKGQRCLGLLLKMC